MIKKILYTILGIISTLLLIINLFVFTFLVLIVSPFTYLVPFSRWRTKAIAMAMNIPALWYRSCYYLLRINLSIKWEVTGEKLFNKKGWYLLVCNHISWLDIPVVAGSYSYKMPVIKFFMKKEILWTMPFVGLACKSLGYPFLSRGKKRKKSAAGSSDKDTTRQACKQIKDHPTTLFMFVEGTRFSEQKKQTQKSPYKYLLKPRAGGMATVLTNMRDKLDGIVDITLNYEPRKFTLWDLSIGRLKKIKITSRVIPIEAVAKGDYYGDKQYKNEIREWLHQVWQQKDKTITEMMQDD